MNYGLERGKGAAYLTDDDCKRTSSRKQGGKREKRKEQVRQ